VDKSIYFHPSAVFMREGCKLIGKGFKTSLFQKISAPLVNNVCSAAAAAAQHVCFV
jgi:hypothetical protein